MALPSDAEVATLSGGQTLIGCPALRTSRGGGPTTERADGDSLGWST
ncbi:hypothetical protein [Nocardia amikacinitolerans]|nr:hypothetical protein [Nocardia amikacinitolerans]